MPFHSQIQWRHFPIGRQWQQVWYSCFASERPSLTFCFALSGSLGREEFVLFPDKEEVPFFYCLEQVIICIWLVLGHRRTFRWLTQRGRVRRGGSNWQTTSWPYFFSFIHLEQQQLNISPFHQLLIIYINQFYT
jgi:hypothetical protein